MYNEKTSTEALPFILSFSLLLVIITFLSVASVLSIKCTPNSSDCSHRLHTQVKKLKGKSSRGWDIISFVFIYGTFFGFYILTFLSFALPGISYTASKDTWSCSKFDFCGETKEHWGAPLWVGSLFNSFLKLPPYYDFARDIPIQNACVPAIYAFFQVSLFCLACVPVFQCRGLIRSFIRLCGCCCGRFRCSSGCTTWMRSHIGDQTLFHRITGFVFLFSLFGGTLLWVVSMGSTCLFPWMTIPQTGNVKGSSFNATLAQHVACGAFVTHTDTSGIVVDVENNLWQGWSGRHSGLGYLQRLWAGYGSFLSNSWFDPRNNILFARLMGFLVIFFGLTLRWWCNENNQKKKKKTFGTGCQRFSIVTHTVITVLVLFVATYARFEIMHQALPTWFFLLVDCFVERYFHTYYNNEIFVAKTKAAELSSSSSSSMKYRFDIYINDDIRVDDKQWLFVRGKSMRSWYPLTYIKPAHPQKKKMSYAAFIYQYTTFALSYILIFGYGVLVFSLETYYSICAKVALLLLMVMIASIALGLFLNTDEVYRLMSLLRNETIPCRCCQTENTARRNDAATTDAATKTGFTGSIISVGCNEDSIGMALKGMKFVDVCGPYEGERPPFVVEVNIKES
tara:strand:+ start:64 stop:1932 length:1869 start_codon:yes stop_codon:yes gene_type:complete